MNSVETLTAETFLKAVEPRTMGTVCFFFLTTTSFLKRMSVRHPSVHSRCLIVYK